MRCSGDLLGERALPELQGLRRWCLVTRDAHGLYRKSGFQALAHPERHMTLDRAGLYLREEAS